MVSVGRSRSARCATNENPSVVGVGGFNQNKHKLFIKFTALSAGYEVYLTDFNGHLWLERLEGPSLQDRLKSETSGLEIENSDLLKLLEQVCQNFVESSCESSSDLKNLILRASVKIGFIKLKWTFKAEICSFFEYNEMIRKDFLMPFFADLREDKIVKDEIGEEELTIFYEKIIPNLKEEQTEQNVQNSCTSIDSNVTELPSNNSPEPHLSVPPTPQLDVEESGINIEELKRKEIEEQLQASKKKKKKLI